MAKSKGLCDRHYDRFLRTGQTTTSRTPPATFDPCLVADCNVQAVSTYGLCEEHTWRHLGRGEPLPETLQIPVPATLDAYGYRQVRFLGRQDLEHRLVMEAILGRPRLRGESVHHINGDRLDNRPENLELWSKYQPPGQRVEDKVKAALALLSEYAPDRLAGDR